MERNERVYGKANSGKAAGEAGIGAFGVLGADGPGNRCAWAFCWPGQGDCGRGRVLIREMLTRI
jgi:hypothetical protein